MDRCLLAVQEASLGQTVRAGAKPANRQPAPRLATKPVQDALGCHALNVDAAADQDRVVPLQFFKAKIKAEDRAVRTCLFLALTAQDPTVKRFARDPVGDAQGFDCPGEIHHRELVQKQEHEPAGAGALVGLGGFSRSERHFCDLICR